MITTRLVRTPSRSAVRAAAVLTVLMTAPMTALSAPATAQQVTAETLLDRIQIEDLLTRYYYDLSNGAAHDLSEYFTEDALLDVDGTVAEGRAEIEALYGAGPSRDEDADRPSYPRGHMLLTNPVIEIDGDMAQAHVIWTGVMNDGVGQAPRLYEQGREDTELKKVDGRWLISRRYISSDSGLPDRFDATYEPRGNPLAE
jgi:hypothetical protein